MPSRIKRVFISDIHMGDRKSMSSPHPYCWFNNNVSRLAQFLEEQLNDPDLKEVVVLGDLFDTWIIPANYEPLTSFDSICSNSSNEPVIAMLVQLARAGKLVYIPGNHDMPMNSDTTSAITQFLKARFPGIRFSSADPEPSAQYKAGSLLAEHGNRYCLFNARDSITNSRSFLPLGYFISRIVSYKVLKTGYDQDPRHILFGIIKKFMGGHDTFIEKVFSAIVDDAGLNPTNTINLKGIPGYPNEMTIEAIGNRFSSLIQNWNAISSNIISFANAILGDYENLMPAASSCFNSEINIVIFGHTHSPDWYVPRDFTKPADETIGIKDTPCHSIYANCGSWVDHYACTYVETEEVAEEGRHYVRIKKYPDNTCVKGYEGFVRV